MWPSLTSALASLRKNGEIAGIDEQLIPLEGFSYLHPTKGLRTVEVNPYALKQATLYLNDPQLRRLLAQYDTTIKPMQQALTLLKKAYKSPGLIWGVSGYSSAGFPYNDQLKIMQAFYDHLKQPVHRPAFITDGGGTVGVLGISGILACQRAIPTIGVLPYPGLRGVGWRTHTLICEKSFPNRQKWVARLPDILLSIGGGFGTDNERYEAAVCDSVIVNVMPHDYSPLPTKKLVVCESIKDIPRCIAEAEAMARDGLKDSRDKRASTFPQLLLA